MALSDDKSLDGSMVGTTGDGTFSKLGTLPRLPLPDLSATLAQFEEWCAPLLSEQELAETHKAIADFSKSGGLAEQLHQALLAYDDTPGVFSWLDRFWPARYLGRRVAVSINANFFFLFRQQKKSQLRRAAELIACAVDYKQRLDQERVPVTMMRDKPLCMVQNKYLFSSVRMPGLTQDTISAPYSESRPGSSQAYHIAVLHNGYIFKLDVVDRDGEPYLLNNLETALQEIMGLTPNHVSETRAAGLLTTLPRAHWSTVRQQLIAASPVNAADLECVEQALFCLCLDSRAPKGMLEAGDQLLHGDGANRWFDKSVSLVVLADGSAGINCEHSGLDGTTVVGFVDALHDAETLKRVMSVDGRSQYSPQFRPIEFKLNADLENEINQSAEAFFAFADDTATTLFSFGNFGASHIKSLKVSPDAFAQLAFQLAHYRVKGLIGATYESISMRHYDRGRTEAMRVVTQEVKDFVTTMEDADSSASNRIATFRRAAEKHVARARQCQIGQAPEQHLWQLQLMANEQSDEVGLDPSIDLFESPGWLKMRDDYLSTSSAPSKNISLFGFGATSETCIGIGYVVWPESISAYLSTPRSVEPAVHEFSRQLQHALVELEALLSTDDVQVGEG